MPELICSRDGSRNPVQNLVCAKCGQRLSRVEVGGLFAGRYRIQKCLSETSTGFRYLAQLAANEESCVIREIIPVVTGQREQLARFVEAADYLMSAQPQCLAPIQDRFTQSGRYYTEEAVPEGVTLHDSIIKDGAFSEHQAGALFQGLLAGLKKLYSLNPPVYIGPADVDKIVFNGQGSAIFIECLYLSDCATGQAAPPLGRTLNEDLYGAAHATAKALAGIVESDQSIIGAAPSKIKDIVFSCTLDWLLSRAGGRPGSMAEVEEFQGLLASAKSEMTGGNPRRAIDILDQAYRLSGSAQVMKIHREMDQGNTTQSGIPAQQPGQAHAQEPVRQPEASAFPLAKEVAIPLQAQTSTAVKRVEATPADQAPVTKKSIQGKQQATPLQLVPRRQTPPPPQTTIPGSSQTEAGAQASPQAPIQANNEQPVPGPNLPKENHPAGWTCVPCSNTNLPEASVCAVCGSSRRQKSRKVKLVIAGVAILTVAAVSAIAFWNANSLMRKFDFAIQKVETAELAAEHVQQEALLEKLEEADRQVRELLFSDDQSAYDLYKSALTSDGPTSSRIRKMNSKVKNLLERFTKRQFDLWRQSPDFGSAEWNDIAEAEEWLASIDPADPVIQSSKQYADAQLLLIHHQPSEALTGFQRALQNRPDWDLALLGIGNACFELKRYACAEEYYTRAARLDRNEIGPYRELMKLYRTLDNKNASCDAFQSFMKLSQPMKSPPSDRCPIYLSMYNYCDQWYRDPLCYAPGIH